MKDYKWDPLLCATFSFQVSVNLVLKAHAVCSSTANNPGSWEFDKSESLWLIFEKA